jgi:hypothetical protein
VDQPQAAGRPNLSGVAGRMYQRRGGVTRQPHRSALIYRPDVIGANTFSGPAHRGSSVSIGPSKS